MMGRALHENQEGVVAVEFLLALLPLLATALGVAQMALIWTAQLAVQSAAVRAARAAAVVLPDEPRHYNHSPRYQLESASDSSPSPSASRPSSPARGGIAPSWARVKEALVSRASSRRNALQRAAAFPLAPFTPPLHWLTGSDRTLSAAGDSASLTRLAAGLLAYPSVGLSVTLLDGPGGEVTSEVSSGGSAHIRVRYLFACRVPLASALLCSEGFSLFGIGDGRELTESARDALAGRPGSREELRERLTDLRDRVEARQQIADALEGVESPEGLVLLLASPGRFRALGATASLPLQSANYERGAR